MMVSLLRLSLWADGEVHQSLCASEIVRTPFPTRENLRPKMLFY
jgi:hypothetical protein